MGEFAVYSVKCKQTSIGLGKQWGIWSLWFTKSIPEMLIIVQNTAVREFVRNLHKSLVKGYVMRSILLTYLLTNSVDKVTS